MYILAIVSYQEVKNFACRLSSHLPKEIKAERAVYTKSPYCTGHTGLGQPQAVSQGLLQ